MNLVVGGGLDVSLESDEVFGQHSLRSQCAAGKSRDAKLALNQLNKHPNPFSYRATKMTNHDSRGRNGDRGRVGAFHVFRLLLLFVGAGGFGRSVQVLDGLDVVPVQLHASLVFWVFFDGGIVVPSVHDRAVNVRVAESEHVTDLVRRHLDQIVEALARFCAPFFVHVEMRLAGRRKER